MNPEFASDVEAILGRRHDLGGDWWTTPDRRLLKGSPFNTLESVSYLLELGMEPDETVLHDALALVLDAWLPDGRFKLTPNTSPLPCQVAFAARLLCFGGLSGDERVQATLRYLLESQWKDYGWHCHRFPYGKTIPEMEHSNPHPTLLALDAFQAAYRALADKTVDGQIVVERVAPKLAQLEFCRKGQPSVLATRRWNEITANLEG
jgi:hypothetical protein